jgi:hypothetical protein
VIGMAGIGMRLLAHLRRNTLGYAALVIALSGTAYAAAKLGPDDIANNAIRSRHIAPNKVKSKHVNHKSLSKRFGTGALGGQVDDFAAGGNVGRQVTIAPIGKGEGSDSWRFVVPRKMRARDPFMLRTSGPVPGGREVALRILRNQSTPQAAEIGCTIDGGESSCRSNAKLKFKRGDILSVQIVTPASGTALPSSDFTFSYRLVP